MAKPNYSFEKRQRELAKKRKKEDKAARKATPGVREQGGEENTAAEGAPTDQEPAVNPGGQPG